MTIDRFHTATVSGILATLLAATACSHDIEGRPSDDSPPPAAQTGLVFDNTKMAADIEQQSARQGTPLHNVVCPADENVAKGKEFDCHAGAVTIHITVTSDGGDYTWLPEPAS